MIDVLLVHMKTWDGKKYYTLNCFLREKFGEKVFKVPLDAGFTCPNRDGSISKGGCIFCSERGSGDFAGDNNNLIEQFYEVKAMMNKKWREGKYIAYFQAYTNTYAPVDVLRAKYESIIKLPDVIGLAIATRPDCLNEEVLELLEEINRKTYLWVELGLQTVHPKTALLINRGYALDSYIDSVKQLKKRKIEVVTHAIMGLPGESISDMLETVNFIANTETQGIKLHLLHLLKNTELAALYERGEFKLMEMDEYVDLIVDCIERIPQDMVIHRITGDGPRKTLIGPLWSLKKWEVLNAIDHQLMDRDTWQGKKFIVDSDVKAIFKTGG